MTTEVIDYDIVFAENIQALASVVRRRISLGWQPQGGVMADSNSTYCQAVVKYISSTQTLNGNM